MTAEASGHIASLRRVLAMAEGGNRLRAFRLFAGEAARLIKAGHAEKADLVDALAAAAKEAGIGGDDAITAAIAEGLAHPHEPLDPVPPGLISRRASQIVPQAIEWLWPGRIALGKQVIVAGEPGLGKSQLALWIAATVTRGGAFPHNEGRAPRGSVVILSAEDDAADTIRPRLDAAGAEVARVQIVSAVKREGGRRGFDLQGDLSLLGQLIENMGDVRLVVVDPISSYLGRVDSHKNAELRAVLEPVGEMAARLRTSILSVTHLNKGGQGGPANSRFIGSVAFVAGPRAAFIVTRDPDDDARRLFLPTKNNLAPEGRGLAFRIAMMETPSGLLAPSIVWDSEGVTMTANEALAAASVTPRSPGRDGAEAFLRTVLKDGPKAVTDVQAEAERAGLAWATVRRAKTSLSVEVAKIGIQGEWFWSLPGIAGRSP